MQLVKRKEFYKMQFYIHSDLSNLRYRLEVGDFFISLSKLVQTEFPYDLT